MLNQHINSSRSKHTSGTTMAINLMCIFGSELCIDVLNFSHFLVLHHAMYSVNNK
jgi:hypothetical protein